MSSFLQVFQIQTDFPASAETALVAGAPQWTIRTHCSRPGEPVLFGRRTETARCSRRAGPPSSPLVITTYQPPRPSCPLLNMPQNILPSHHLTQWKGISTLKWHWEARPAILRSKGTVLSGTKILTENLSRPKLRYTMRVLFCCFKKSTVSKLWPLLYRVAPSLSIRLVQGSFDKKLEEDAIIY
jgi:hypothetical protein